MLRLIPAGLHRLAYRLAHAVRIRYWQATGARLNGVAVVATDLNDQLLLIRLSYGSGGWNLPTGGLKRGEDKEVAARRELEEETGWRADRVRLLMQGPSSAGMSNEIIAFARASGLTRVGPGGGDDSEDIIVHEVPRTEAAAWLCQKAAEGYAIDPKLYAGLYFVDHDPDGTPAA